MNYYTVLLTNGTVGKTSVDCEPGDMVSVSLNDKNGMPVTVTGVVKEILTNDDTF